MLGEVRRRSGYRIYSIDVLVICACKVYMRTLYLVSTFPQLLMAQANETSAQDELMTTTATKPDNNLRIQVMIELFTQTQDGKISNSRHTVVGDSALRLLAAVNELA